MVPKPNGKWCLVIDYHHLNTQVLDDPYSLPVIEDMILGQKGKALSSVFDLEDRFHQMHLAEESHHLTAFVTP